jgi:hypothetical protein
MTHFSRLVTVSTPLTANVPCTPHQAPAGLAAHNSRPTDTVDHVHSCAAGVTGFRNQAVGWCSGAMGVAACADAANVKPKATAINLVISFLLKVLMSSFELSGH